MLDHLCNVIPPQPWTYRPYANAFNTLTPLHYNDDGQADLSNGLSGAMLTISSGYDPLYLTRAVAAGRENYYLSAIAEHGEPPGIWTGQGCPELGLQAGAEVGDTAMEALYGRFTDPRDPHGEATLGRAPRSFAGNNDKVAALIAKRLLRVGCHFWRCESRVPSVRCRCPASRLDHHFEATRYRPGQSSGVILVSRLPARLCAGGGKSLVAPVRR